MKKTLFPCILFLSVVASTCLVGCSDDKDEVVQQPESSSRHISELTITDDVAALDANETIIVDNLVYQRKIDSTRWESLYVPFSMSYDEWKDAYDIAEIKDVTSHSYGCTLYGMPTQSYYNYCFEIKWEIIKEGRIEPNTPYLIRAKKAGSTSINIKNANICVNKENIIPFGTSYNDTITLRGVYNGLSGSDVYANKYMLVDNGKIYHAQNESSSVRPMSWFIENTYVNKFNTLGVFHSSYYVEFDIWDSEKRDDTYSGTIEEFEFDPEKYEPGPAV